MLTEAPTFDHRLPREELRECERLLREAASGDDAARSELMDRLTRFAFGIPTPDPEDIPPGSCWQDYEQDWRDNLVVAHDTRVATDHRAEALTELEHHLRELKVAIVRDARDLEGWGWRRVAKAFGFRSHQAACQYFTRSGTDGGEPRLPREPTPAIY
jgi:hypothetical protein